jgi:Zn-dependent protease
MLNVPSQSDYDLSFKFLGFPVRVTWSFWLMGALLGWGWSQMMDRRALALNVDTPGAPALLILWIACVFLTILVHELGHALAMRYYGQRAYVILYHFGGLAVSDSFGSWDGARRHRTTAGEQLIISAAGPAAQLLLALVVWVLGLLMNVRMFPTDWAIALGFDLPLGTISNSIAIYAVVDSLLWTSIFWALLNLVPILPLDGGQIMYNLLLMTRIDQPRQIACMISIAAGGLVGIGLLTIGSVMGGAMFLMLAAQNWQEMQPGRGGF